MKKSIALLTAILMMCPLLSFAAETPCDITEEYTNNEIFVMYKNGSEEVFACENKDALREKITELSENEGVLLYQPNYIYENTAFTEDEYSSRQWALFNDGSFYMEEQKNDFPVYENPFGNAWMPGQWRRPDYYGMPGGRYRAWSAGGNAQSLKAMPGIDINAAGAWSAYNGGVRDVTVALVDTGVDYTHSELSGRMWTNSGEIDGNGIDDDGNGYIDDVHGWNFYSGTNAVYTGGEDDHGTHGAGTIAAAANNGVGIAGVAQSEHVKVMSVKALGGINGDGTTASIIKAIRYAEQNGASICNLSLGTSNNDKALYYTMLTSNMLFVVAAGNNGNNTDYAPCYPASYDLDNIISVANICCDGALAYSSNYGVNTVDIAAPGSYILSTTGNNSYSIMSGTSMSAPFVSAACALLYTQNNALSLAGVKDVILASAKKIEALNGAVMSGGMLDVGAALAYDTSGVQNTEWNGGTANAFKGSAPQISAQMINSGRESRLMVRFYDEECDIIRACYGAGELTSSYFSGGGGYNCVLPESGTVYFEVSAGKYTFYAVDSAGNETVKTVEITSDAPQGYPKAPSRRDFSGQPSFGGGMERLWDALRKYMLW